jgi:hypothetical protein
MVGKASAQECSAQMAFVGGKFEAARQFNKEASQTRDCCGANNAPHRAARLDSHSTLPRDARPRSGQALAAQSTLARNDIENCPTKSKIRIRGVLRHGPSVTFSLG